MIPMFFTKPVLNTPQLFTFFGNGNWLLGCLLLFASMIKVIYLFMYDPSTYITACAAMIQGHDLSLVRSKVLGIHDSTWPLEGMVHDTLTNDKERPKFSDTKVYCTTDYRRSND